MSYDRHIPWWIGVAIFAFVFGYLAYEGVQGRSTWLKEEQLISRMRTISAEDIVEFQETDGRHIDYPSDKAALARALHSLVRFRPSHPMGEYSIRVITGPRTGSLSFEVDVAKQDSQRVGYIVIDPKSRSGLNGYLELTSPELETWLVEIGLMP